MELFKYNTNNIKEKLQGFDFILDDSKHIALVRSEDYTNALKNIFPTCEQVYIVIEYHMFNFLTPDEISSAIRIKTFDSELYSVYSFMICLPDNHNLLVKSSDCIGISKYVMLIDDVTYS